MATATIDPELEDIRREYARTSRPPQEGPMTNAQILAQAARRIHARNDSIGDPFKGLPQVAKRLARNQADLSGFVDSYYTTGELASHKVKGFLYGLIGREYRMPALTDVIGAQMGYLDSARDNLTDLVMQTEEVLDELNESRSGLRQSRTHAASQNIPLRESVTQNRRKYEKVCEAMRNLVVADPEYAQWEEVRDALDTQYFAMRRDTGKTARDIVYATSMLSLTQGTLEVVREGLLVADTARDTFDHAYDGLEMLTPFFGLAKTYGDDRTAMLALARDVGQTVERGIAYTARSFDAFGRFGTALGGLDKAPDNAAYKSRAYAERASKVSASLFGDIGARADAILDGRG